MRLIAIPLARARPGLSPVSTFLAQRAPVTPSFVATRPLLAASEKVKEAVGEISSDGSKKSASSAGSSPADAAKGHTSPPAPSAPPPPANDASDAGSKGGQLPLMSRVMNKAADFWVGLGREDQKSFLDWKKRTYVLGESLMDRIEYEEWALKGVDPALGPSLTHPATGRQKTEEEQAKDAAAQDSDKALPTTPAANVALLYPPSLLAPHTLVTTLKKMTAARQPYHRQRLIWCIVGMPFTIPFMLIPVIPNLPFFYLAWRAWSHWRAFQSSKYLTELLQQGRIVPSASSELDRVFAIPAPPRDTNASDRHSAAKSVAASQNTTAPSSTPVNEAKKVSDADVDKLMILKEHHIKMLSDEFKMERQLSIDLKRARLQTIKSISMGQLHKLEAAGAEHNGDAGPTKASKEH